MNAKIISRGNGKVVIEITTDDKHDARLLEEENVISCISSRHYLKEEEGKGSGVCISINLRKFTPHRT